MGEHPRVAAVGGESEVKGVDFRVIEGRAVLRLKSWRSGAEKERVALAGRELPVQVGAIRTNGGDGGGGDNGDADVRVLCMGPGDWLVVAHGHRAEGLQEEIKAELSRQGVIVVGVSDGLVVIEGQGSAIGDVLSKGCGLDIHRRSFPAGRCARTRLAQIPVVVVCLDESARFELIVARSYSQYLQGWLRDAAMEFGGSISRV